MLKKTLIRACMAIAVCSMAVTVNAENIDIFQSDGGEGLRNALENLNPGDRLTIHSGSYQLGTGFINGNPDFVRVGNGQLRGGPGQVTEIRGQGSVFIRGNLEFFQSAYVTVSGLTIHGSFPQSNGTFIQNQQPGLFFLQCRNIDVLNNTIAYCGGGGINFNHSDYINIDRNVCHDNCRLNPDQHSGISIYQPVDMLGNNDGRFWRIRITRNICHDNRNDVPNPSSDNITDGNGIILDDYKHTQSEFFDDARAQMNQSGIQFVDSPYYRDDLRTLVEGNACSFNGGSGIHAFLAVNVFIKNNTCVGNVSHLFNGVFSGQFEFQKRGQISLGESDLCLVLNNVMVATDVEAASGNTPYAASDFFSHLNFWTDNLAWSTVSGGNTSLLFDNPDTINFNLYRENPQLENLFSGDFRPRRNLNRGQRWENHFYGALNETVPPDRRPELGAYEFQ